MDIQPFPHLGLAQWPFLLEQMVVILHHPQDVSKCLKVIEEEKINLNKTSLSMIYPNSKKSRDLIC